MSEPPSQKTLAAESLFLAVTQQDKTSQFARKLGDSQEVLPDKLSRFFGERIKGRKLPLANPDRPRPEATAGNNHVRKEKERKKRVTKRWRQALKAEASRKTAEFKKEGQNKAAKDVVHPLSRKPKAKKLALDECRQLVTDGMLMLTHKMWTSYVQDILHLKDKSNTFALGYQAQNRNQEVDDPAAAITGPISQGAPVSLSKADLTGASLQITHSSNPEVIGIFGFVIQETEQTFMVATPPHLDTKSKRRRGRRKQVPKDDDGAPSTGNQAEESALTTNPIIRQIPKHNSTFTVLIPVPPATSYYEAEALVQMELYGNQIKYQPATRATKKAKARKTIEY